jgi:hypothetical protein
MISDSTLLLAQIKMVDVAINDGIFDSPRVRLLFSKSNVGFERILLFFFLI